MTERTEQTSRTSRTGSRLVDMEARFSTLMNSAQTAQHGQKAVFNQKLDTLREFVRKNERDLAKEAAQRAEETQALHSDNEALGELVRDMRAELTRSMEEANATMREMADSIECLRADLDMERAKGRKQAEDAAALGEELAKTRAELKTAVAVQRQREGETRKQISLELRSLLKRVQESEEARKKSEARADEDREALREELAEADEAAMAFIKSQVEVLDVKLEEEALAREEDVTRVVDNVEQVVRQLAAQQAQSLPSGW